jgi:deoxyribose-phosphate aldolase
MEKNLNAYFDHSLLRPESGPEDIRKLCRDAVEYDFYGIAINPFWVLTAAEELKDSRVKIISVSGFPLSANRTDIKIAEAAKGVEDGADEIDMVANIGLLRTGAYGAVEKEISLMKKNLPDGIILKVIIEAPLIPPEAQVEAVKLIINSGADYVKTSTGFFGGASVEIVKRLYSAAGGQIKVKASGGIRTLAETTALIAAGAERIGSSASVEIIKEHQRMKPEADK